MASSGSYKINKRPKYDMDDEKKSENNDGIVWLPSSSRFSNQSSTDEKVLYGAKFGDRRVRVDEPYKDKRAIIQCIGQLKMVFADDQGKIGYVGTGTVVGVKDGFAFIITCAHNVTGKDDDNNRKYAESIKFEREIGKWGQTTDYDCDIIAVHENYVFQHGDINDLAILRIRDDGFYKNVFKKNQNVVHYECCDKVKDENKGVVYGLYGYPKRDKNNEYSKVEDGELWGMEAPSYKMDKGIEMKIYKNKSKTQYIYNAIDTEGGQSGSALFTSIKHGEFSIVGIHTTGDSSKNRGVALNGDKINWLNDNIYNDPLQSNAGNKIKKVSLRILEATPCHSRYPDDKPENILKSDDSDYTSSKSENTVIIFENQQDQKVMPKKIKVRGLKGNMWCLKDFNLFTGDKNNNKWIKINEDTLTYDVFGDEEQTFDLNISSEKENKIKEKEYVQYKLVMINNYGEWYTVLKEFKLFGYLY